MAQQNNSAASSRKTGSGALDILRRVPPHSVEAEQAVLGGLFCRKDLMQSLADVLTPDDFYLPSHTLVFRTALDLFHKSAPIDLVTVGQLLKDRKELEDAGGAVYLAELAQAVVSGANAEYYATIVRDKALQRRLIEVCSGIISNCFDAAQEVPALLDESERAVFEVGKRVVGGACSSVGELLTPLFEKITRLSTSRELVTGVTTGYARLDKLTTGLQPSDLIILAARPSMGKTAFALNMALAAAVNQNIPTVVFSLEMSKEQLMQRLLAVHGKVDMSRLRRPHELTDEDREHLFNSADILRNAPLYIDDSPALSTLELRARARRLQAEKGVGLVLVDYLQLMRASRVKIDSRELEISDISRSLKALAKELNVPVVALSQLNRKVEDRSDKRPILSDLRESGAIEQDADVIMFIYRDDVYKYPKASERPSHGPAEIIVGKQRNGPVGTVDMMYMAPYTSFEDIAPERAVPPSEFAAG